MGVYNAQKANTDMVYCFKYEPSDESLKAPQISYPPTKEELFSSDEGRAGRLPTNHTARTKRVEELYDLFLSYVQGVHVGRARISCIYNIPGYSELGGLLNVSVHLGCVRAHHALS